MKLERVAAYREGADTTIVLRGRGLEGADALDAADIAVHKLQTYDQLLNILSLAGEMLRDVENAGQIQQTVENLKKEVRANALL